MDIQFTVQHNIGNTVMVPNQLEILATTFFTQDTQPTATTLNVVNTSGFVATGVVLLGELVQENAEFKAYSAISSTTITSAATAFAHNRGDGVNLVNYDQVVVETAPTPTGSWTVLGTFSFDPTQEVTNIQHGAGTINTYYRIKFRNSSSTLTSAYSAVVSPATFDPRSVAAMFSRVTTTMGISPNDTIITTDFLLAALNEGRQYVDNNAAGYHWDFREKFNFPIQLLAGTNFINLPSDIDFTQTNRAILALRYPRTGYLTPIGLTYIDKKEWNRLAYQSRGSVTSGATLSGAVTMNVVNAGDFLPGGGVAFVATENFTQTIMQIQYTGVNLSTNQLTGVTGITRNISDNIQVFSFTAITAPYYYTVFEDILVFDRIIPDSMQGTNVYMDYYKRLDIITDVNTLLPERHRDIFIPWLKWKIKMRKDKETTVKDSDFLTFNTQLTGVMNGIWSGQTLSIIP